MQSSPIDLLAFRNSSRSFVPSCTEGRTTRETSGSYAGKPFGVTVAIGPITDTDGGGVVGGDGIGMPEVDTL